MKILFVDDDYSRLQEFKRHNPDVDITWCQDYAEAYDALVNTDTYWGLIMLDYDLGPKDTVMPFVNLLTEIKILIQNSHILIHSTNPFGAADIIKQLALYDINCSYIPGAFLFDIKRWAYWN